jgi:hypothetical protein
VQTENIQNYFEWNLSHMQVGAFVINSILYSIPLDLLYKYHLIPSFDIKSNSFLVFHKRIYQSSLRNYGLPIWDRRNSKVYFFLSFFLSFPHTYICHSFKLQSATAVAAISTVITIAISKHSIHIELYIII